MSASKLNHCVDVCATVLPILALASYGGNDVNVHMCAIARAPRDATYRGEHASKTQKLAVTCYNLAV